MNIISSWVNYLEKGKKYKEILIIFLLKIKREYILN